MYNRATQGGNRSIVPGDTTISRLQHLLTSEVRSRVAARQRRRGRLFAMLMVAVVGQMWLAAAVLHAQEPSRRPPNFVVIFIDDLGYGDIEPFGSKLNATPHLRRMAAEGLRLTSSYVAAPVCTPSRAALLTGCYPIRVGLARGSGHAVLFPGDHHGLHPDEVTVAELLREVGYRTGCFGKWHLGDQPGFLPNDQGFESYFGIPYSNDMWPGHGKWRFPPLPLLRNDEVVGQVADAKGQAALCRQFTEEAIAFMRQHRQEPFFVYLPHAFVHHPRHASERFVKATSNPDRQTGGQIAEIDWSVGQVLETIRELELEEQTLVWFTSDNGGARGCVNRPLRGGKGSAFEGGFRVPTLAWWPGEIPANSVCDEVVTAMDLLPTLASLAGAEMPQRRIDGHDVSPLLRNEPGAKSATHAFYYYQQRNLRAVRVGPWKLFTKGQLYHLLDDLSEQRNVADEYPNVVAQLATHLEAARHALGDGDQIGSEVRPVGSVESPRTLLPREGLTGAAAFAPSFPRDQD